ncbi:MAG: MarR family winged helix-turn-helix transcriptional regulator [Pseudomonas sp.]
MTARLKVVTSAVRRASLVTGNGTEASPALENSLGFLVCDTARYIKRVLYARLAPYGIPGSCWFVLRALWQRDNVSQRELSAMLGLAEPALMMSLRSMERLGLVSRKRDETDKRRINILLTQRAHDMEEELLGVADEINRAMLATISEKERSVMMSSLRAVHAELARACDGVLQPIDDAVTDEPAAASRSAKKGSAK